MEKRNYKYWNIKEIEELKLLYPNSLDLEELANKFGVSKKALIKQCSNYGIKRDVKLRSKILTESLKGYKLDKLVNFDTNFNWYWYGFILADGHVNESELNISLSNKDLNHLKILSNYLEINIREKNNICQLRVGDIINLPLLKNKLKLINSNKTLIPPNINEYNISKENMLSLIIGYIDGDGNIEVDLNKKCKTIKMEVHNSWIKNLEFISIFFKKNYNIDSITGINKRGYAYFRMNKHNQILNLINSFKLLKIPYLSRKWDKINLNIKDKSNFFEDRKDEIYKLFNEGYNLNHISKILNINYGSLYNHKKKILNNKI